MRPKLAWILIGLAAVSGIANAKQRTPREICELVSGAAKGIMMHRQDGVPRATALAEFGNPTPFGNIMRGIVREAHDVPRFSSFEYKTNAIDDFGDRILARCLKEKWAGRP